MNLLGSTESKITKDKNGGDVPQLKIALVVSVHCNPVNNDHQQDSIILYSSNKWGYLGQFGSKFPNF